LKWKDRIKLTTQEEMTLSEVIPIYFQKVLGLENNILKSTLHHRTLKNLLKKIEVKNNEV